MFIYSILILTIISQCNNVQWTISYIEVECCRKKYPKKFIYKRELRLTNLRIKNGFDRFSPSFGLTVDMPKQMVWGWKLQSSFRYFTV